MRTLLLAAALAAGTAHAADLTIEIAGNPTAPVYAALYSSADGWLRDDGVVKVAASTPDQPARLVFTGLAPGRYAFTFFEDANGNRKLDRNALGIPTERWGASRDASGRMGPPTFEQAVFELQADLVQKAGLQ